jgi:hypothetical protein
MHTERLCKRDKPRSICPRGRYTAQRSIVNSELELLEDVNHPKQFILNHLKSGIQSASAHGELRRYREESWQRLALKLRGGLPVSGVEGFLSLTARRTLDRV